MMSRLVPPLFGLLLLLPAWAEDPPASDASVHVVMHKNPGCGCCDLWAEHLRSHGFTVESIDDPKILAFKEEKNIPAPLMSCHTAVVAGYVIEGHVPADDVKCLISSRRDATGIAVPGMPVGSPNMEQGDYGEPYRVFLFSEAGKCVFAIY